MPIINDNTPPWGIHKVTFTPQADTNEFVPPLGGDVDSPVSALYLPSVIARTAANWLGSDLPRLINNLFEPDPDLQKQEQKRISTEAKGRFGKYMKEAEHTSMFGEVMRPMKALGRLSASLVWEPIAFPERAKLTRMMELRTESPGDVLEEVIAMNRDNKDGVNLWYKDQHGKPNFYNTKGQDISDSRKYLEDQGFQVYDLEIPDNTGVKVAKFAADVIDPVQLLAFGGAGKVMRGLGEAVGVTMHNSVLLDAIASPNPKLVPKMVKVASDYINKLPMLQRYGKVIRNIENELGVTLSLEKTAGMDQVYKAGMPTEAMAAAARWKIQKLAEVMTNPKGKLARSVYNHVNGSGGLPDELTFKSLGRSVETYGGIGSIAAKDMFTAEELGTFAEMHSLAMAGKLTPKQSARLFKYVKLYATGETVDSSLARLVTPSAEVRSTLKGMTDLEKLAFLPDGVVKEATAKAQQVVQSVNTIAQQFDVDPVLIKQLSKLISTVPESMVKHGLTKHWEDFIDNLMGKDIVGYNLTENEILRVFEVNPDMIAMDIDRLVKAFKGVKIVKAMSQATGRSINDVPVLKTMLKLNQDVFQAGVGIGERVGPFRPLSVGDDVLDNTLNTIVNSGQTEQLLPTLVNTFADAARQIKTARGSIQTGGMMRNLAVAITKDRVTSSVLRNAERLGFTPSVVQGLADTGIRMSDDLGDLKVALGLLDLPAKEMMQGTHLMRTYSLFDWGQVPQKLGELLKKKEITEEVYNELMSKSVRGVISGRLMEKLGVVIPGGVSAGALGERAELSVKIRKIMGEHDSFLSILEHGMAKEINMLKPAAIGKMLKANGQAVEAGTDAAKTVSALGWKVVPLGRKGYWVPPAIAPEVERFLGAGGDIGTLAKGFQKWFVGPYKMMLVPLNMMARAHNTVANSIQIQMATGEYNPFKTLGLVYDGLKEIAERGTAYREYASVAPTLWQASLRADVNIAANDPLVALAEKELGPTSTVLDMARKAAKWSTDKARAIADTMSIEEKTGKMAIFKFLTEKKGLSSMEAMLQAEKYMVDYTHVPTAISFLRSRVALFPFITFTYKQFGNMAKGTLLTPEIAGNIARTIVGIEDSVPRMVREAEHDVMPDWMKEQTMVRLGSSKSGKPRYLNVSAFLPWNLYDVNGNIDRSVPEPIRAAFANLGDPYKTLIELATNQNLFTGATIAPEGWSWEDRTAMMTQYVASRAPQVQQSLRMLHSIQGQPTTPKGVVRNPFDAYLNIMNLDMDQEANRRLKDMQIKMDNVFKQMRYTNTDKSLSPETKLKRIQALHEHLLNLQQDYHVVSYNSYKIRGLEEMLAQSGAPAELIPHMTQYFETFPSADTVTTVKKQWRSNGGWAGTQAELQGQPKKSDRLAETNKILRLEAMRRQGIPTTEAEVSEFARREDLTIPEKILEGATAPVAGALRGIVYNKGGTEYLNKMKKKNSDWPLIKAQLPSQPVNEGVAGKANRAQIAAGRPTLQPPEIT